MNLMTESTLHEAEYYELVDYDEQIVRCHLCPHECKLESGERGICKARKNIFGKLYNLNYGFAEMKIDLIEKQYVYHFFPNSRAQTFAAFNCNLDCDFCTDPLKSFIDPEENPAKKLAPDQAIMFGIASGSKVISFGESEPLISYEWVRDTAKLAKDKDLKVLLRTNGYFKEAPLREILNYVDAVKIDIKAATDEGYIKSCGGGSFEHVKNSIKIIHEMEKLIELSIVIHDTFDNVEESVRKLSEWIKTELSPSVPLHLSRLKPAHRTKHFLPTSLELLEKTYDIAKETGLQFVYLDDVPDHDSGNTYCPQCGELLIERTSIGTEARRISLQGHCNKCQTPLNIMMS